MSGSSDDNDSRDIMQVVDELDLGPLAEDGFRSNTGDLPDISGFPSFSPHTPMTWPSSLANTKYTSLGSSDSSSVSQTLSTNTFAAQTQYLIDTRITNGFAPVTGPSDRPTAFSGRFATGYAPVARMH